MISRAPGSFFTEVASAYKKYKGNDQYELEPEFDNP
jgi:hypothetical protein